MIQTDAHHHIWERARRPHAWLDDSGMAAIRRDFTLTDLALLGLADPVHLYDDHAFAADVGQVDEH